MVVGDHVSRVCQVLRRLPRTFRFVVADPIHQVKQLATQEFGIEDLRHLTFWCAVHNDWRRRRHDTTGERVGIMWLQKADVENRVDLDGGRQLQAICRGPDLANHREGTETPKDQFCKEWRRWS